MALLVRLILWALALCPAACSGASIQHRQYWPDPDPVVRTSQECIEISLTYPRWSIFGPSLVVVNSSSGGTQGDIRFETLNLATGISANCTARDIDLDPRGPGALDIWHNCSIPNLFFQFTLETLEMRLKGGWHCNDTSRSVFLFTCDLNKGLHLTSKSLEFTASGPWEVPLIHGCLDEWNTPRGQQTMCIMGNSQVSAGLSSPLAIYPQLPLLPYTPRERATRCVDRSWDPEWQVNALRYHHHSVRRDNKTSISYDIALDVTNISDGQNTNCSVTVDLEPQGARNNGSTPWIRCNGTGASVDVTLDTNYNVIGLRQSWECSDGVSAVERNQFNGIAYTNISLTCGSPLDTAVLDPQGAIVGATADYNCSLSTMPITFTGYVDSAPAMPHTYYARSCTIESMVNLSALGLREYRTESIPMQPGVADNTSVLGSFTLHNPGSGDIYKLYRMPVIDDGGWHECAAGQGAFPWQLVGCRCMLDNDNHRLGFQIQWFCDDRDPSNAILFSATAEEQIPAEVCEIVDGEKTCSLPVDVAELAMSISSLTWTTTGDAMDRGPTLPWI